MMARLAIAAVSPKKTGTTNGRQWTLYEVRGQDGKTFSTLQAEWALHVGETVEVDIDERGRLARYSAFPKSAPRPATNGHTAPPAPAVPTPAPDRFAILSDKLDQVLGELAAIRRHFA